VKDEKGRTPLLCAIHAGWRNGFWKEQTIQILLDNCANPNATSKFGLSCLEAVDDTRVLKILLQHGVDIKAVPGIIQCAVDKMDAEMVQVLVNAGVYPNCLDPTLRAEFLLRITSQDILYIMLRVRLR
jgi:hypothetical protein